MKRDVTAVVEKLCDPSSFGEMVHFHNHEVPMPSRDVLREIMGLVRAIIFPGYYKEPDINRQNLSFYTGAKVDRVLYLLSDQIKRGICFTCELSERGECRQCEERAKDLAFQFVESLPLLREMLSLDVEAAYLGDPAATSHGEAIFCYPSIYCMTNFRVAHQLYELEVPLIPRILTEMAHSATGIDIHPQAQIGKSFFMDHGTGIVIGGTSIIGDNVKVYQNVTLGAKSFPLDKDGNPVKGIARHPIVEDNVVVYGGAKILGRVTIGKDSVIGGNVWLMESVAPGSRIYYTPGH